MYTYDNYYYPSTFNPYEDSIRQQQLSQLLQLPQWQQLQRRVAQLERENNLQDREIDQLRRRLQRINQRLRTVENRLNIPFTPFEGEF
ncbi:hypothetical protein [Heyndrickxia camelliae]|uniref:Uncharacterized protein n=1 Tax=Heyndrickxia camelliae TaxID=1707093 RepID=A0A2N3LL67_9BACI|nr:hypothetical protein [Heyndrickxia camelliae]PKR85378.1 hypothetical protein CWO92_09310 [Heyndrickxia camelliae]